MSNLLEGTNASDTLYSLLDAEFGEYFDLIVGYAGNDTIYGGGYRDHLEGGNDSDTIYGYFGDDDIYGGTGNDFL